MTEGQHPHPHDHARATQKRLILVLALTVVYTIAEVVGGIVSNSLALLADAGHMLTDDLALALAVVAAWVARRPPDEGRTYGYQRAEILAALANGTALVVICGFILWQAVVRLAAPPPVAAGLMGVIAAGGLVVNLVGARILWGHARGLNARGALLHLVGDLLGSLGAIAAAGAMAAFGWRWADPVASVFIGGVIVFSSVRLVLDSIHVLMEGAPAHLDYTEIARELRGVTGVIDVHDLHVWTLGGRTPLLTAHLVVEHTVRAHEVLREATRRLRARFDVEHVTLQIEPPDFNIVGIGPAPVDTQVPSP